MKKILNEPGIYCFKNMLDGKKYVGCSNNILRRTKEHLALLRKNRHDNSFLQDAFNKNKEENFIFYTIEVCDSELFDEKEIYYIKKLRTHFSQNGYNISYGGNIPPSPLGKKMSEETKQKLRDINLGRKMTDADKKKIGERTSERCKNPEYRKRLSDANKGHTPTDETREKLSKSKIGKKRGRSNGHVGVTFNKKRKKWVARFTTSFKKQIYVGGYFKTEQEAIIAWENAYFDYYGKLFNESEEL